MAAPRVQASEKGAPTSVRVGALPRDKGRGYALTTARRGVPVPSSGMWPEAIQESREG